LATALSGELDMVSKLPLGARLFLSQLTL